MAYKKQVQGRSYPHLYNVTMTVGSRKALKLGSAAGAAAGKPATILTSSYEPNKRDDVMLVQYLLKRVYQQGHNAQPPLKSGSGDPHSPAALKIDGLCGSKTQGAIEQFQLEMRRNGRNIATDGCVDSERGESATASVSKTGYTISWLNKYFWILYPLLAPDISIDPECPPELKQAVGSGGF